MYAVFIPSAAGASRVHYAVTCIHVEAGLNPGSPLQYVLHPSIGLPHFLFVILYYFMYLFMCVFSMDPIVVETPCLVYLHLNLSCRQN